MNDRLAPYLRAFLTPLTAVCLAGMVMAGGSLLLANMWGGLWLIIILFFSISFVGPIVLFPAGLLAKFMMDSKGQLSLLFQGLSLGWIFFIFSFWGSWVFDLSAVSLSAEGWIHIAALLWCVSATAGPWVVFARKDRDNVLFTSFVIMLWIGAIVLSVFSNQVTSFWPRAGIIAGVMTVLTGAQSLFYYLTAKRTEKT